MFALAEVQIAPIGHDVSTREEVEKAQEVLARTSLKTTPHATGTNVEGQLEDVLAAVRDVHKLLHSHGVQRLQTVITLDTRIDK